MREPLVSTHIKMPSTLRDDLHAASEAAGADDLSSWLRPELRKLANRTLAKHGDPRREGK